MDEASEREDRAVKNQWRVLANPVGDIFFYQVYRIRNTREPMHSGNIETTGEIFKTEEEAQAAADRMNEAEGRNAV